MIFKPKARFELLDQYLARRDYTSALEAITDEIKRRPESFNLLLRQAEILGMAGDRSQAIEIYRKLAEHYAREGFYARAIAVANKVLRLDPSRKEVTHELARLISAQQGREAAARKKLERASVAAGESQEAPAPSHPPAPPQSAAPAAPAEHHGTPKSPETPSAAQLERERDASAFFSSFPAAALEELLASTSVRTYSAGEVIVREGEPGRSLFLIENGVVEVLTHDPAGKDVVLAQLGPGEFFGEVAVLTGRPRTATIVATNVVTAIEIARDDLERIGMTHPEVRDVLERFYRQRAQATVEAMLGHLRKGRG
jgi:tetratricopeptide (TPR) repeat protein